MANAPTAFDDLLAAFSDPTDQEAFKGLAEKYPSVKQYGMRQSDYSRKMNEVETDLKELKGWRDWRQTEWVPDETDPTKGYTKAHLTAIQEAERLANENRALNDKIAAGGDMTFADLKGDIDNFIKEQGLVDSKTLSAKEEEFKKGLNSSFWAADTALKVNTLTLKHYKEFGEVLDGEDLVKQAQEKGGLADLKSFYDTQISSPKKQQLEREKFDREREELQKRHQEEIERITRENETKIERVRGAAQGPSDGDGPEMGGFQRRYQKLDRQTEGGAENAPDTPLGDGSIAAYAANEFINGRLTSGQK